MRVVSCVRCENIVTGGTSRACTCTSKVTDVPVSVCMLSPKLTPFSVSIKTSSSSMLCYCSVLFACHECTEKGPKMPSSWQRKGKERETVVIATTSLSNEITTTKMVKLTPALLSEIVNQEITHAKKLVSNAV